jgi:Ran-binding protein 9/10
MRQRKRRKTMRPASVKTSASAAPPPLCVNGVCAAQAARHPVPSVLNAADCAEHLTFCDAGLSVEYTGPGLDEKDAASVRTDAPVPTSGLALFYFEATVVQQGELGRVGVGLCEAGVSLNKMPGWSKGSFGYHGDDGCLFRETGKAGEKYSSKYGTGDTIGCCWDMVDDIVFFTRNGDALGTAFQQLSGELYPTVGMQTKGGRVSVNFGIEPFLFDIDSYARSQRDRVIGNVLAVPLPDHEQFVADTVLAYMINAGYARAAEAFARESGRGMECYGTADEPASSSLSLSPAPLLAKRPAGLSLGGVRERQHVLAKVMAGQIESALLHARAEFPTLEITDEETLFLLKTQHFIEMLQGGKSGVEDAVEYGRAELVQFHDAFRQRLEEVYSLLAYSDASCSPVAHLVHVKRRARVALSLNSAILESLNFPARSVLEQILAQSHAVLDLHADTANGPAAILDVDTVVESRL